MSACPHVSVVSDGDRAAADGHAFHVVRCEYAPRDLKPSEIGGRCAVNRVVRSAFAAVGFVPIASRSHVAPNPRNAVTVRALGEQIFLGKHVAATHATRLPNTDGRRRVDDKSVLKPRNILLDYSEELAVLLPGFGIGARKIPRAGPVHTVDA